MKTKARRSFENWFMCCDSTQLFRHKCIFMLHTWIIETYNDISIFYITYFKKWIFIVNGNCFDNCVRWVSEIHKYCTCRISFKIWNYFYPYDESPILSELAKVFLEKNDVRIQTDYSHDLLCHWCVNSTEFNWIFWENFSLRECLPLYASEWHRAV